MLVSKFGGRSLVMSVAKQFLWVVGNLLTILIKGFHYETHLTKALASFMLTEL